MEEKIENILDIIDRLNEKMDSIEEKLNKMIEEIENISSEKIMNDAVTSMNERWDTTGPR